MLQLIAYSQNDETPVYLDIDEKSSIAINYSATSVKDFSKKIGSRSDQFSLPFSEVNNKFFGHNYNINISESAASGSPYFNLYLRTNCEIRVDGIPQIDGYLFVMNIDLTSKRYQVAIMGQIGNLSDSLGDKKLVDLDSDWQNEYSHQLSKDNIVDSWDGAITYNGTPSDAGGVVYPFINYGINNRIWEIAASGDIRTDAGAIQPYELKPCFRVKTLFDRILAEAGFSYQSDFFDNDEFNFSDIYLTLANDTDIVKFRPLNYGFGATLSTFQNIISSDTIIFNDEEYDPNTVYNSATGIYTAPLTGTYVFKFTACVSFERIDAGGQLVAEYYYQVICDGTYPCFTSQTFTISPASDGSIGFANDTFTVPVNLNLGQTLQVTIIALNQTGGSPLNNFDVNPTFGTAETRFELLQQPYIPNGADIYLQDNWPDITQKDFIKSIFEHFNMFVEPLQDDPNVLIIEPYPDYIEAGSIVDWTEKLVKEKSIQIIPTTSFRNKKIKFEYVDANNYLATYAREVRRDKYGSYVFNDKSQLTTGEFTNFTVFAPPTIRTLKTSGTSEIYELCLMDLSSRNSNGSAAPNNDAPRIFYFKKKTYGNVTPIKMFDNDTLAYDDLVAYGYAGHYSDVPLGASDFDLNWRGGHAYNNSQWVQVANSNNPFLQYWKPYLNEIYSQDARMISAYFYLTPRDIQTLRFNNSIFVKDTYYRINNISGYNPNQIAPCKVELIKLMDTVVGLGNNCEVNINTYAVDGRVEFVDSEGATTYDVSRDCCEGYGFNFILGVGCFWKKIGVSNNDEFNPEPNAGSEGGG